MAHAHDNPPEHPEPPDLAESNTRLFVWFRVLFNCRFYYPIYTILFLDFGLTLAEFATLNVVWAVVIVLLEVPSGALADQIGRRRLVVIAAFLMVAELALICFIPVGGGPIVFWMFFANRVLSAMAEAAASGADEALAYDSIAPASREAVWPKVMGRLVRLMAVGFIFAGILGGVSYSASALNSAAAWVGWDLALVQSTTIKFPIYLNLLTAVGALAMALRMRDPHPDAAHPDLPLTGAVRRSFEKTFAAGAWILRTPAPFLIILLGVLLDGFIRLYLTVAPNFWRLIGFDESWFGVFMAAFAILGILTTGFMEKMATHGSPLRNFTIVAAMALFGLALGLAPAFPLWWGVVLVAPLHISMRFLQFFLSHYLNRVTDSAHRATVLSFKGLAINLVYGIMTGLFALQSGFLEARHGAPELVGDAQKSAQSAAFAEALTWWPWAFVATMAAFVAFKKFRFKNPFDSLIERPAAPQENITPPGSDEPVDPVHPNKPTDD